MQNLSLPNILVEVEKRGSSFAELLTIPEQDDWVYSDGKSTSCVAFILEMYKEAGLFGELASSIQVTEFTVSLSDRLLSFPLFGWLLFAWLIYLMNQKLHIPLFCLTCLYLKSSIFYLSIPFIFASSSTHALILVIWTVPNKLFYLIVWGVLPSI